MFCCNKGQQAQQVPPNSKVNMATMSSGDQQVKPGTTKEAQGYW